MVLVINIKRQERDITDKNEDEIFNIYIFKNRYKYICSMCIYMYMSTFTYIHVGMSICREVDINVEIGTDTNICIVRLLQM